MENIKIQDLPEDNIHNINITPETIKIANEWNSGTCIHPIIIPTNNIDDLQMQYQAWLTLSITKRRISDSKAIEIFGVTNTQMYDYILADLYKRNAVEKDTIETEIDEVPIQTNENTIFSLDSITMFRESIVEEGKDSVKYAIYENLLKRIERDYPDNDISLQAFIELKKLNESVNNRNSINNLYPIFNIEMPPINESTNNVLNYTYFNEGTTSKESISVQEWNELYEAYLNGFLADDFKNSIKSRDKCIKEFKSNSDMLRSFSECGYNIETNNRIINENNIKIRELCGSNNKIDISDMYTVQHFKNANCVNIVDVSNMSCNYITENYTNSDIRPIFLIQSYAGKWYSKIIKKFTKGPYSHISISIDPTLNKLYSFQNNGFQIEDFNKYATENPNSKISIYCMFVSSHDYQIIENKIDYFLKNIHKTKYNWVGLFKIMMKRTGISDNKLVCSQFVDLILKCIDIDLTDKDPSLATPNDFKLSEKQSIYLLYDDIAKNITSDKLKEIFNKVDVLSNSIGCTYKDSIAYNSAIKNILANENDLSLLRAYKDKLLSLESDSSSYLLNLKPYIETYVFDLNNLPKNDYTNFKYDGRQIKELIEGV